MSITTANAVCVNALSKAVFHVLMTTTQIEDVSKERQTESDAPKTFGELSGIMGIDGELNGAIALSMNKPLAELLVSRILGCDASDLSEDDVKDGVGEFTNMISGYAKQLLIDTRFKFAISLPKIVTGKDEVFAETEKDSCLTIVFNADGHELALQLCAKVGE